MDNKNYYQEIISKINSCIADQKWDQALALVSDELQVAYIPKNYLDQFSLLHQKILHELKEQKANKSQSQIWSLEKITKIMKNYSDPEMHAVSFYHLKNHNVRLILPVIREYLMNNTINNINKTQLLYVLKSQAINENFKLIKNKKIFQVNPINLIDWKESLSYQKVNKLLEQSVAVDNPGIHQICCFLLNSYYQSLIPDLPSSKHSNAIAAAIYIRACSLQFIKVTLLSSANKFHSTTKLIKQYLLDINQHKIT